MLSGGVHLREASLPPLREVAARLHSSAPCSLGRRGVSKVAQPCKGGAVNVLGWTKKSAAPLNFE